MDRIEQIAMFLLLSLMVAAICFNRYDIESLKQKSTTMRSE